MKTWIIAAAMLATTTAWAGDTIYLPAPLVAEDGATLGVLREDPSMPGRLCISGPNLSSCVVVIDALDSVCIGSDCPPWLRAQVQVRHDAIVNGHLALGPDFLGRPLDPDGSISLYRALDPYEIGAYSVGRVFTDVAGVPTERHRWIVRPDGSGCLSEIPSDWC